MKRTLHIFFYVTLFSIIGTILFSVIWIYDNGKRMAANPNLNGEWVIIGVLGVLLFLGFAGMILLIVGMMKGMDLTRRFLNFAIIFFIGLLGVLPILIMTGYLLIQTPNPFRKYKQVPDIERLTQPNQSDSN